MAINACYWMYCSLLAARTNLQPVGVSFDSMLLGISSNSLLSSTVWVCCLFEATKQIYSSSSFLSKDVTTWPGCGLNSKYVIRVVAKYNASAHTATQPIETQKSYFKLRFCFLTQSFYVLKGWEHLGLAERNWYNNFGHFLVWRKPAESLQVIYWVIFSGFALVSGKLDSDKQR